MVYRIYSIMTKELKDNPAIKSRPTCMICGNIIKEGESFVASRRYKKTYFNGGVCKFKHYIHSEHLNKRDLEKYYLKDVEDEL